VRRLALILSLLAVVLALSPLGLPRLLMPVLRAGVIHDRATVYGTPKQVSAYLAKFSNAKEWDPGCLDGKPLDDGPVRVGSRFWLMTIFKGTKSEMIYTITRYEPPNLIELHGESSTVTAIDTIRLSQNKDDKSKTDIDYTVDLTLKGWRRPFIMFLSADLDELGRRAMAGMEKTITKEKISQFTPADAS